MPQSSHAAGMAFETGSSSSSESDTNASASQWRGVFVAISVLSIAVGGSNVAGAYVRGSAAAAAAIRSLEKAQAEYDPSGLLVQALQQRAGRDPTGSNPQAQNTAFEWARKLQAQEAVMPATFNESVASGVPVETNYFWGNDWLQVEVNRILGGSKETINEQMHKYLSDPNLLNKLDFIEYQHGLSSMIIDDMECPYVNVNKEDGTAEIVIVIKAATQGPLGCGGHLYGDKYPFTLKVSGIGWSGRHVAVNVRLGMPFAFTSVKSGWIQGSIGNMDGICYGKTGGDEDKACSDIMNKKLQAYKGDMVYKMSQELTHMMQKKLDQYVTGFMHYDYDYDSDS